MNRGSNTGQDGDRKPATKMRKKREHKKQSV